MRKAVLLVLLLWSFNTFSQKSSYSELEQKFYELDTNSVAGKLKLGIEEFDYSRYILSQHYFLRALKQAQQENYQHGISSSYNFLAYVNYQSGNIEESLEYIDEAIEVCSSDNCRQFGYLMKLEILCHSDSTSKNKVIDVLDSINIDFAVKKFSISPIIEAYLKLGNIKDAKKLFALMKPQIINYHDSLNYYTIFLDIYSQEFNSDSLNSLNKFANNIPPTPELFQKKIEFLSGFLEHKSHVDSIDLLKNKLLTLRIGEKKVLDQQIADAVKQSKEVYDLTQQEVMLKREKESLEYKMLILIVIIFALSLVAIVIFILNRKITRSKELIQQEKDTNKFLLNENNHRIKNNLQIILSIISLSKYSEEDSEKVFTDIENRIRAISTLQDYINDNNAIIRKEALKNVIKELLNQIDKSIGLNVELKFEPSRKFSNEFLSSFAIMLNEMITNSIKHSFKTAKSQQLELSLIIKNDQFLMNYNDYSMVQEEKSRNLGIDIIEASIAKHNGERLETKNNIYQYKIAFPLTEVIVE